MLIESAEDLSASSEAPFWMGPLSHDVPVFYGMKSAGVILDWTKLLCLV